MPQASQKHARIGIRSEGEGKGTCAWGWCSTADEMCRRSLGPTTVKIVGSRNNEGISCYCVYYCFLLSHLIGIYYMVLLYAIPGIQTQTIIKFLRLSLPFFVKDRKVLHSIEASPAPSYIQIIVHIHPHISSIFDSIFILLRFGVDLCHLASAMMTLHKLSPNFSQIMQKVSLGIFFCSLSCCWRCQNWFPLRARVDNFSVIFSRKASMLIWQSPNWQNPRFPSLSTHTCHSTRFK